MSEPACIDDYVEESAHWIIERTKNHNGRDHTSHVLKHSIEKSHKNVSTIRMLKLLIRIFVIIYKNGDIAKELWIKGLRPTLKT